MSITYKRYTSEKGFTPDFQRVWEFLLRFNQQRIVDEGFLWGRWEWCFCLERYLDTTKLSCIGLWEDDGKIVAIATYEQSLGYAWLLAEQEYNYLRKDMLEHAMKYMSKDGSIKVLVEDTDREFQNLVASKGLIPTQEKETNAYLPLKNADLSYHLPEGFRIVSMAEEFNLLKYNRCLHRGFNHEGEPEETTEMIEGRRVEQSSPHTNRSLKISVAAPDGSFVAYCGMWYVEGTDYALVEPVATDPDYRKMGLGKAAVLEGVKRCKELGAKVAFVGSSQQFYYSIGFRPYSTKTWWEKKL